MFTAQELLGDFYKACISGEYAAMDAPLKQLKQMISGDGFDVSEFIEYFNGAFNDYENRDRRYPSDCIFRELLRNAFDSYYATGHIKITVDFKENGEIRVFYNDAGFSVKQFLCFLERAKGVFANAEQFLIRRNNFSFSLNNTNGVFEVIEFNISCDNEIGETGGNAPARSDSELTEISLKVSDKLYGSIKENFLTLTDKKGNFINLAELCFAFNRKNVMNIEEPEPAVCVTVAENGAAITRYEVAYHHKADCDIKFVRLFQDGSGIIDFICYEYDGFHYLVPFAVTSSKRQNVANILLQKYNFFATYELSGLEDSIDSANPENGVKEQIIEEKLSAFFISVPDEYVTKSGSGVKAEAESAVTEKVERGVRNLIKTYDECFTLDVYPLPETKERYGLRPRSYAYGFIKNFIKTSKFTHKLKDNFRESVSLQFPGEGAPVAYRRLKETAFRHVKMDVPEQEHRSGAAYSTYITAKRDEMFEQLSAYPVKTLYLAYRWNSAESGSDCATDGGREFYYEFVRPGNTYIVESKAKAGLSDYGLYINFNSSAGRLFDRYTAEDGFVEDEDALEAVFSSFDETFHEEYRVKMRYFQLYVTFGDERHVVNISKIKVNNLKNAMETLAARRDRFDTARDYDETAKMLLNVFTQGKDTTVFLSEIRRQGGEITLAADETDGKLRFYTYGNRFSISSRITVSQMLEIIPDVEALNEAGLLNGREFGSSFSKTRYIFKAEKVRELLEGVSVRAGSFIKSGESDELVTLTDIENAVQNLFVCDSEEIKWEKIALLNSDGRTEEIVGIDELERGKDNSLKYVILNRNFTKAETAGVLERLLTGEDKGLISGSLVKTVLPNIVLTVPSHSRGAQGNISRGEFELLRNEIRRLSESGNINYRNYLAANVSDEISGYGGRCPICGFESPIINCFAAKDFVIEFISSDGMEKTFKFTLYMCANDYFAADGWVIEEISIGGMEPFTWLEKISGAQSITPELLICRIRMSSRTVNASTIADVPRNDREAVLAQADESPKSDINIELSPLMAAKWVEDNEHRQSR
jgi:hypothetical protein